MKCNSYFLYILYFLYTVIKNILYNDDYDYRNGSNMCVKSRPKPFVSEPFLKKMSSNQLCYKVAYPIVSYTIV